MANQPTTLIQHIAHYGTGDINAWQAAGGATEKIPVGKIILVIVYGSLGICLVSFMQGFAVGAAAFGVAAAPFVIGGAATVGATWAGIKGVTVWQRRLLKQAATVQPALPLPAFDYKALPEPARNFALEYYAHTGKHLTPGQLETLEMQLVAAQLTKPCAPLQPSLPSASSQQPISYSA